MQEMSIQAESQPLLLPGATKRITAMADAPTPPPLESELHRFIDLVICDGRYLHEVSSNPRWVSEQLGFDLSLEAEAELRAKPLQQHTAGLYAVKFEGAAHVAIIIIVAAIIIIIAIVVVRYNRSEATIVRDVSPRAKLKL